MKEGNKMDNCFCCNYRTNGYDILFENEYTVCIDANDPVLIDSCVIIPKEHKKTPFDLSHEEWMATQDLLHKVKQYLDNKCSPHGYNLGWNCGEVAGQTVFHSHLHVIPRYSDEPYSGLGIRYWLKQTENKRPPAK